MVKAEDKECCKKSVLKTLQRIATCLLPLPKGTNRLLPVALAIMASILVFPWQKIKVGKNN